VTCSTRFMTISNNLAHQKAASRKIRQRTPRTPSDAPKASKLAGSRHSEIFGVVDCQRRPACPIEAGRRTRSGTGARHRRCTMSIVTGRERRECSAQVRPRVSRSEKNSGGRDSGERALRNLQQNNFSEAPMFGGKLVRGEHL